VIGLGQAVETSHATIEWLTFMFGSSVIPGSATGPGIGYPEDRFVFLSGPPDIYGQRV
jgi:hypothetical protein